MKLINDTILGMSNMTSDLPYWRAGWDAWSPVRWTFNACNCNVATCWPTFGFNTSCQRGTDSGALSASPGEQNIHLHTITFQSAIVYAGMLVTCVTICRARMLDIDWANWNLCYCLVFNWPVANTHGFTIHSSCNFPLIDMHVSYAI